MSSIPKLTKKQKKAQAFRSRRGKTSLGGKSSEPMDMEENAVPIIEDQDFVESIKMEVQEGDTKAGESVSKVVEGKKRKREQEKPKEDKEERVIEASSSKPPKTKKRKVESVEGDGAEGSGNGDSQEQASPTKKKTKESKVDAKQRFILFVGNLKFSTTREAVEAHFSACDPPPSVRLMTPKPNSLGKSTSKSKGFAFVEFVNKVALQQALRLHHTELDGRKINVELTAGGGGKSETRISKVKERNKELHEQRVKRLAKQKAGKGTEESGPEGGDKPSRYSATSGIGQVPSTKRTWTVGDVVEDKKTKKRGSKKKPPRSQGTGVNAIPVG